MENVSWQEVAEKDKTASKFDSPCGDFNCTKDNVIFTEGMNRSNLFDECYQKFGNAQKGEYYDCVRGVIQKRLDVQGLGDTVTQMKSWGLDETENADAHCGVKYCFSKNNVQFYK